MQGAPGLTPGQGTSPTCHNRIHMLQLKTHLLQLRDPAQPNKYILKYKDILTLSQERAKETLPGEALAAASVMFGRTVPLWCRHYGVINTLLCWTPG